MARVLVVDEEESVCRLLEIAFRKDGHAVESVTSGGAAKEKVVTGNHDIIISDDRMPDISGIDLLEAARAAKRRVPFILMTAAPTLDTAILAVNLHAHGYLIKTENLVQDLRTAVEEALNEKA